MTDGEAPAAGGARSVIIVAADRPELYEYLRKGLAGLDNVEIIVDQRIPGPRTDGAGPPPVSGDQWQPDIYDELTLRGFVIKRLGAVAQDRLDHIQA